MADNFVDISDAVFTQGDGIPGAHSLRRQHMEDVWPGVTSRDSFRVTFSSGMTVAISSGSAWIKGQNIADQGLYRVNEPTNKTLTVAANGTGNPRVDQIVLRTYDAAHDTSGLSTTRIYRAEGTATAGATLDNRSGAADLSALAQGSKNVLLLADILVGAGVGSLSAGVIRERRPYAIRGNVPMLDTNIELLAPSPSETLPVIGLTLNNTYNSKQSAALVIVPRRGTVNGIRFAYRQSDTPLTGNYQVALYDSSGYRVGQPSAPVVSGVQSFTGGATTRVQQIHTFSQTVLEPGYYYLWFGMGSLNAGAAYSRGMSGDHSGAANEPGAVGNIVVAPSTFLFATTGGTGSPAWLLSGFTDAGTTGSGGACPVPLVTFTR